MHFLKTKLEKVDNSVSGIDELSLFSDFKDEQTAQAMLQKILSQLHDPYSLQDMDKLCAILLGALSGDKRILIYGDYDLDGMSAAAAMYRLCLLLRLAYKKYGDLTLLKSEQFNFLRQSEVQQNAVGAVKFVDGVITHEQLNLDIYIPDRLDEGYGLGSRGIEYIIEKRYDLVITVDCGIKSVAEVTALKQAGISVLVSDHHECGITLPCADAVVNPKRNDDNYLNRDLSGSAVILKIAGALDKSLNLQNYLTLFCLDTAFLGIISDVMPLTFENRLLIRAAFVKLRYFPESLGLTSLMQLCKIDCNYLNYEDFAFNICPKFNACGRIGDPYIGVLTLLAAEHSKAEAYAKKLINYNDKRKSLTDKALQCARQYIDDNPECLNNNILCVPLQDVHPGVIGIVAAKLKEEYLRPCICFALTDELMSPVPVDLLPTGPGDGLSTGQRDLSPVATEYVAILRGSARSVDNFNFYDLLAALQKQDPTLLQAFGGHNAACGLSIRYEDFEKFNKALQELTLNLALDFVPGEISLSYTDELPEPRNFAADVKALYATEPYGPANPAPRYLYGGSYRELQLLGNNKQHLKLTTVSGHDCLIFNNSELYALASNFAGADLYLKLKAKLQVYRGQVQCKSYVEDYVLCPRSAGAGGGAVSSSQKFATTFAAHADSFNFASSDVVQVELKKLNKQEIFNLLAQLFKIFKTFANAGTTFLDVEYFLSYYFPKLLPAVAPEAVLYAIKRGDFELLLQILQELRIIRVIPQNENIMLLQMLKVEGAVKLEESKLFASLASTADNKL